MHINLILQTSQDLCIQVTWEMLDLTPSPEVLVNPFVSIGHTGTSNVSLLESAGRRTVTSNDISSSKVSLYIFHNMVSFLLSFMVLGKHSNL